MALKAAVKVSRIKPKVARVKKTHEEDGLAFKTKEMLSYYQELKDLRKRGIIKTFELPTVKEQTEQVKKNKYNSVKVMIDDIIFQSKLESRFYAYLMLELSKKLIKCFECQVKFELQPKYKKNGKTILPITYTPDFKITYNDNTDLYIDTKGRMTEEFKIKQKMFNFKYPDLTLKCLNYDETSKLWCEAHAGKKSKGKKK